jgi:hypothetical protein
MSLDYEALEASIVMYRSTVHPYCSTTEEQLRDRVTFPAEFQTAPASVKARTNMRLLAAVEGNFYSPYTDEFNKVFSLDQYGLLRQIPTDSGWIRGGVKHETDLHASLYQNPMTKLVMVEARFEVDVTPVIREVLDEMQTIWADDEVDYFAVESVSPDASDDDDASDEADRLS